MIVICLVPYIIVGVLEQREVRILVHWLLNVLFVSLKFLLYKSVCLDF